MISLKNSLKLLSVRNCCVPDVKHGCTSRLFSTSICRRKQEENVTYPPNSSLQIGAVQNRNPRNLEKLRIGEKPMGWDLEKDGKLFWNKVILEISNKQIKATVEHFRGDIPVTVGSQEWCIAKHLYSVKDLSAIETVGRVLAKRCLEAGITSVYVNFTQAEREKEKIKLFLKALDEGGLNLEEGSQFNRIELDKLEYKCAQEKSWQVFEELDAKILSKVEDVTIKLSASK